MERHSNKARIYMFAAILVVANIFFNTGMLNGQISVLNNNLIRIGDGSVNSINTKGKMEQPFYYNSDSTTWYPLTSYVYPLDNSFAVGGDGTNEWNLNGTLASNPSLTSQVIDLSGYVVTSSPNGYGTIISTGIVSVGGYNLEIKYTYELEEDNSFIKITTRIRNISGSNVANVRYWVGTRDDYIGGDEAPLKEKGNLVDGAFVKITNKADRASALRISSEVHGVLFYTKSPKGNNIINSCCSWSNVTNTNPQLSAIEVLNDGSYGFYVRMNDLANGESDEFEWYYAASKLSELEDVVKDVATTSGAVSDISYTTATFKAKTSTAGTGYWMVVPRYATPPTEAQIKSGIDYGSVVVAASGSGEMLADVYKYFYLTGLTAGTNWDLYFVSEDATPAFSTITKVQFTTKSYSAPALSTTLASSITLVSASSGGVVINDGGQPVSAYGVCWNTSGTPTMADTKTSDGSGTGTFTSSLTGLTEGTTYYVRAYATNSVGTTYGNQILFTTLSTSLSGSTGGTAVAPNALVYIAQSATIQGTTLVGASASIYNNYHSDQDILGIDGVTSGTVGSIDYSFNSSTGILTMEGSANAADYQALIRKLTYSNTNPSPNTSTRAIKISLNDALAFDGNGHFYEYVTSPGINWTDAKTAASGMKYFGLQGYLVTLTSAEESTFVISKLLGQGWLGASDVASEGTWRWATGPENGTLLSYTNWNSGEPNNEGDEDCAQFVENGLWNDLNSATLLDGYVVEYGGMTGDPVLDISDNVSVTINIPTTTAATSIEATSFIANWSVFAGSTDIFLDVATDISFTNIVTGYSNKELGNVPSYNVTDLNPNTTYYYRVRMVVPAGTSFNSTISSTTTLKREQTITFGALSDKTYGDSDFDLTATASSSLPVTYSSSNTAVATVTGGTVHILAVGNTTITASQPGNSEYYAATDVQQLLEVEKGVLTVTADAQAKVYGSANPTLTFQYSGFVYSDDEGDLTTVPTVATAIDATTVVGDYDDAITVSGGTDENYTFAYVSNDFSVTKATLTVTADSQTKIYGEANPVLTFQYAGFVNGDDEGDLATLPSASTTIDVSTPVGEYTDAITVAGGTDENYDFTYVGNDFSVTKTTLTVTADAQTKTYGDVNPTLTLQYTGFLNGDDEGDLATVPIAATAIDATTVVGEYADAITVSGGADENYTFVYVGNDFSVTKATLTVTADAQTKVYGDVNPTLTLQYSGFVNGDDEGDLATVPTIATAIDASTAVGEYADAITVAEGDDENYTFTYVNNDFTVTKATLTARAENQTRVYLEPNPVFTVIFSGFVNGEELSDIDVLPTAGSDVDENTDAGIYPITVSGGTDENYMFAYENGTITIDKADQTITFNDIPEGLRMTEEYQLDAEATSGLSISYESSDPGIGSISGDILSIIADGDFTVTATQDGNNNWNPAEPVIKSVSSLASFDNIMSLFTPNNDGINDYWYIPDMEEYGNISVTIYNRFGNKVYESRSYNNDWDGIWNGKQLPSASYYYIIKSENKGTINGVVNIVR